MNILKLLDRNLCEKSDHEQQNVQLSMFNVRSYVEQFRRIKHKIFSIHLFRLFDENFDISQFLTHYFLLYCQLSTFVS